MELVRFDIGPLLAARPGDRINVGERLHNLHGRLGRPVGSPQSERTLVDRNVEGRIDPDGRDVVRVTLQHGTGAPGSAGGQTGPFRVGGRGLLFDERGRALMAGSLRVRIGPTVGRQGEL